MIKISTKVDETTLAEIEKSGMTTYSFLQEAVSEKLMRIQLKDLMMSDFKKALQEQSRNLDEKILLATKVNLNTRDEMLEAYVSQAEKNRGIFTQLNEALKKIYAALEIKKGS